MRNPSARGELFGGQLGDDLFGDLINRLFDMWGYAPAETFRHWTPAEEDDFLREIALYCAELDILQETN